MGGETKMGITSVYCIQDHRFVNFTIRKKTETRTFFGLENEKRMKKEKIAKKQ